MAASGLCVGCGACAAARTGLDMRLDRHGQFKPAGSATRQPSEALAHTCPFSPAAIDEDRIALARFPGAPHHDPRIGRYEAAFVGWASERGFRDAGSSGGLTTWLACELLRRKLIDGVAHVAPGRPDLGEPLFGYRISRTEAEIRARAKSRYYPVEMSGVLAEIRATPGRYAVMGIPCFIKAVNLLRAVDPVLDERIVFTIGLFCGHMKSARLAESFAWQLGSSLDDVARFEFRRKDSSRPANWYRTELELRDGETRAADWWHLADGDWGAGFFQNAACDFCDDVVAETADISFGDAWVEPYQNDGRGTNVVIVRAKRMHALLRDAMAERRVALEPVDADFVVRTQAAGFRHRREGLAYRLARRRRGLRPLKRVPPGIGNLTPRRRAVYAMRQAIARWSHRIFWLARTLHFRGLYLLWAKSSLRLYQALAHSRGWLGALIDRWEMSSNPSHRPGRW